MAYLIKLTEDAVNQLSKIPRNIRNSILNAIEERLTDNPHRFKPLICKWKAFFRMRFGDYRIIYKIDEAIITVIIVKIAVRGNVYDK